MAIKLAGGTTPYILKEDRESDNPTVFNIADLTASQRGQIDEAFAALPQLPEESEEDKSEGKAKESLTVLAGLMRAMDAAYRHTCEIGISSVSGVLDAEGKTVELPGAEVIPQLRDPAHIRELGKAVLDNNKLSEDERETPSGCPGMGGRKRLQGLPQIKQRKATRKPKKCEAEQPTMWVEDGVETLRCPAWDLPKYTALYRTWHWASKGHLPHAGGSLEQPAKLMDALSVIDQAVAEYEKKRTA